jgi:hypothetical protein
VAGGVGADGGAPGRRRRRRGVGPHGEALLDLAEVLRLGGRADHAAAVLQEAARLFGRKGNRPLAGQAAAALRALPRSGASPPDGGDSRPDAG